MLADKSDHPVYLSNLYQKHIRHLLIHRVSMDTER